MQGCDDCQKLVHPPVPICPICRSRNHSPRPVSGRATVIGFTVNYHQWLPGFDPPYVIANVAIEEDAGVRLTTNVINCDPSEVHIGQQVKVVFEQQEDVWLPFFEPTGHTDPDDRVGPVERPVPRA
ncbi:MAG TPA: OB-fold domain-containing protein, partial [Acidimicrobiales bacterium]|nr:OB-fold domain-containing protein [Acidimicrobiales bacterium]